MTLRRLNTPLQNQWVLHPCRHSEHNPPSHIVLDPGTWEHTCPGCGKVTVFRVERATL